MVKYIFFILYLVKYWNLGNINIESNQSININIKIESNQSIHVNIKIESNEGIRFNKKKNVYTLAINIIYRFIDINKLCKYIEYSARNYKH